MDDAGALTEHDGRLWPARDRRSVCSERQLEILDASQMLEQLASIV